MVSIIICTHNRAAKLDRCLKSIRELDVPLEGAEVLVVDNNSRDNTGDVVHHWAKQCPMRINYLFEPRQGLAIARNRGVAQSQGAILAFTDDDCVLSHSWCNNIAEGFSADRQLMVLGGRVIPYETLDERTGVRGFADAKTVRTFSDIMERMIGCNMAMRRHVLDTLGNFDERLGAGSSVGSAEDIDFFYRAVRAGMRIDYLPQCVLFHGHGRVTHAELSQIQRHYMLGRGAFYAKHALRGDKAIGKAFVYESISLMRSTRERPFSRNSLKFLGYLLKGAWTRFVAEFFNLPGALVRMVRKRVVL